MYRVTPTLLASRQLTRSPGLYEHVRRILIGTLETARELRKLHSDHVPLDVPLFFTARGHVIWYALDLEQDTATILDVEPIPG